MRSYIFTKNEIRRLLRWLKTGEEDETMRQFFSDIRRNRRKLSVHRRLLLLVMDRLKDEGRLRGRTRLPRELSSKLRSVESKLALKRREQRISDASRSWVLILVLMDCILRQQKARRLGIVVVVPTPPTPPPRSTTNELENCEELIPVQRALQILAAALKKAAAAG